MTNSKLIQLKSFLPIIQQITGGKIAICLFDKEGNVIGVTQSSEIQIPHTEGMHVDLNAPEYGAVSNSIKTGKSIHNKLPREVFGISMEGDIIPVFDESEVVGAIVTSFSTEKNVQIQERSDILKNDILSVETNVRKIGDASQELLEDMANMQAANQNVTKKIKEAADVIKLLTRSAGRSNILALNASIEAARAGEVGKGFAVVASEMGKFSKESGEMTKKIEGVLQEIVALTAENTDVVNVFNDAADSQVNTVNEIVESLTRISDKSIELAKLSDRNS